VFSVIKKRELNDWLKIVSVIAIVIIFLRQFILYNVPEIVPFGEELGELLYDSCVGYLVTYWFYYLTVYRRDKQYNAKVYKFVKKRVTAIINDFNDLTSRIYSNAFALHVINISDFEKKESLRVALGLLNPSQESGVLDGTFTPLLWGEFIKLRANQIERSLRDIFIFVPYLEYEDIEIFSEIYSSNCLEIIKNIDLNKLDSLEFLADPIDDLNELIKKLKHRFPEPSS
jgi:hypothetical protein